MKSVICLALFYSQVCFAGSANCTSPTHHITSSGDYNASLSDCIVSVEKTSYEVTAVYLPTNPSSGDEFTVTDATSYSLDQCDPPYWDEDQQRSVTVCSPAGVDVASSGAAPIDGSNIFVMSGYYDQASPSRMTVKFTYGGSGWVSDYSYWKLFLLFGLHGQTTKSK